jgi:hypothetical protein
MQAKIVYLFRRVAVLVMVLAVAALPTMPNRSGQPTASAQAGGEKKDEQEAQKPKPAEGTASRRPSGSALALAGADKKDPVNDLLGVWTVVHSEVEGDAAASLSNPPGRPSAGNLGTVMPPMIWKIGSEIIQQGWENLNFPQARWQCQWNPGGKMGTVDLTGVDKDGKKLTPPLKGIYLLKDDVLMICHALDNGPPPERFTTAAKSKSMLLILRRGK